MLFLYLNFMWFSSYTHISCNALLIPTFHVMLFLYPHFMWCSSYTQISCDALLMPTFHVMIFLYQHFMKKVHPWAFSQAHPLFLNFSLPLKVLETLSRPSLPQFQAVAWAFKALPRITPSEVFWGSKYSHEEFRNVEEALREIYASYSRGQKTLIGASSSLR